MDFYAGQQYSKSNGNIPFTRRNIKLHAPTEVSWSFISATSIVCKKKEKVIKKDVNKSSNQTFVFFGQTNDVLHKTTRRLLPLVHT